MKINSVLKGAMGVLWILTLVSCGGGGGDGAAPAAPAPTGQVSQLTVSLSGSQEVPPVTTTGTGTGTFSVNTTTNAISGTVTFSGLSSAATAGHIHTGAAGANGAVIIPLTGGLNVTAGTMTLPETTLTAAQVTALTANGLYTNIHTGTNLNGEIRAQILFPAGQYQLTVPMSGAQEVPAVTTTGTGTGTFTVDFTTKAISGTVTFSGLSSASTAGHIRTGLAGANGAVLIPLTGGLNVVAGTMTLPQTTLTADQVNALTTNGLYTNIHTNTNAGGEIRGQLLFSSGTRLP